MLRLLDSPPRTMLIEGPANWQRSMVERREFNHNHRQRATVS
jgi:hypothetical protein